MRKADLVDLTYGPRMGAPIIFATAKILKVEIRPFETAMESDLHKIALGWETKSVQEFVAEYTRWFAKELYKGYPVAWVHFTVIDTPL
jgi:hypothetical protein